MARTVSMITAEIHKLDAEIAAQIAEFKSGPAQIERIEECEGKAKEQMKRLSDLQEEIATLENEGKKTLWGWLKSRRDRASGR